MIQTRKVSAMYPIISPSLHGKLRMKIVFCNNELWVSSIWFGLRKFYKMKNMFHINVSVCQPRNEKQEYDYKRNASNHCNCTFDVYFANPFTVFVRFNQIWNRFLGLIWNGMKLNEHSFFILFYQQLLIVIISRFFYACVANQMISFSHQLEKREKIDFNLIKKNWMITARHEHVKN